MEMALLSAEYLSNQHPNDVEYLFHLSQLQAHSGKYEDALQSMNKIEALIGINENLVIEKHSLYLEKGDVKGAENEFLELIEAYPNNSEYLVFLGDFYIQQKDYKRALPIYQRVVDEDPANGQVYFSLANYYYHNNNIQSFKVNLEKGFSHPNVDLDSKIQRILPFLMGVEEQDNPVSKEDIKGYLDHILSIHPYESSIHVLNGNFQKHIGNDSLAILSYETALLIDEQQEDIWHEYLLLLFSEEFGGKFLSEASKAVKMYPENGVFNYFAGFANMMNEHNEEAIHFFNNSIEKSADNDGLKSQVFGLLGDLYFQVGDREKSFDAYDKSLEIKNDNVVVLNNYAYYLSLVEMNLDKAEEMVSNVIQLEPGNATYLDTYAWVLFKRGKFMEALFIIEQAIENGGDKMGVVLEHYGDILYKVGNKAEALKYWQLALESDDDVSSVLEEKIESGKYIPEI
jgi:tetratricopeptide (TPR) repeat protein